MLEYIILNLTPHIRKNEHVNEVLELLFILLNDGIVDDTKIGKFTLHILFTSRKLLLISNYCDNNLELDFCYNDKFTIIHSDKHAKLLTNFLIEHCTNI